MLPEVATNTWLPLDATLLTEFTIHGEPKPAGSKSSGILTRFDAKHGRRVPVLNPATGMPRTFTRDSSGAAGQNWRADVRQAAADALPDDHRLVEGPLAVEFVFFRVRPGGHFRTGRFAGMLRDSAPMYPTTRPDALKLARAVEDALTGLVWRDDSQIVEERLRKDYADAPGCAVRIWGLAGSAGVEAPRLVVSEDTRIPQAAMF